MACVHAVPGGQHLERDIPRPSAHEFTLHRCRRWLLPSCGARAGAAPGPVVSCRQMPGGDHPRWQQVPCLAVSLPSHLSAHQGMQITLDLARKAAHLLGVSAEGLPLPTLACLSASPACQSALPTHWQAGCCCRLEATSGNVYFGSQKWVLAPNASEAGQSNQRVNLYSDNNRCDCEC